MYKIYIAAFVAFGALLAGCTNSDKEANKNFVKAALKVSKSAEAFENADYAQARSLAQEAKSDVDRILAQNPDSAIALKIVSEPSTQIGVCSFRDLSDRLLPSLDIYNTPNIGEVSFAWAIACAQTDATLREDAFYNLALDVISAFQKGNSSIKNSNEIVIACLPHVLSPEKKILLASLRNQTFDKQETAAKNTSAPASEPIKSLQKIKDEKTFLADATRNAALVSYDLKAIEELEKKAELAQSLNDKKQFLEILKTAFANIQKITMQKTRDFAMSRIAAAFVKFGAINDAIEIAKQIKTPEHLESILDFISLQSHNKNDCLAVIALAKNIKLESERDIFYAELAKNSVSTLGADSIEIVKLIKNPDARNVALIKLGQSADNVKMLSLAASNIDMNLSDAWIESYSANSAEKMSVYEKMSKYIHLANWLSKENPELAKTLCRRAVEIDPRSYDQSLKSALTSVYSNLANVMCAVGEGSQALDLLAKNMQRFNVQNILPKYCDIACKIYPSDPKQAIKSFSIYVNICLASPKNSMQIDNIIYLAISLQSNKISPSQSAKILKPFMPKFK